MDLTKIMTDDEYQLFKKELRLTQPYYLVGELWQERILTDDLQIIYGCRKEGFWELLDVKLRSFAWQAWEDTGETIVNIRAIKKLELYGGLPEEDK